MPLSTNTRTAVRRLAVSGTELSTFWIDCTTSMRMIPSIGVSVISSCASAVTVPHALLAVIR